MPAAAHRSLCADGRAFGTSRRLFCPRQVDRKRRTFAQRTAHSNFTARLLGEPKRLTEAQTCTLANVLGCEEGLEDCFEFVSRNARTSIFDRDGDELPVASRVTA